jgi:hypothetical protein
MWSGETKTGWVATNSTPTSTAFPILSTKKRSVQKTTICSYPTFVSFPHIALKKTTTIYTKKARYLRVLGAKKRVVI